MKKIAIIGSGITGLTTALALSEKGHKVTIYEQSDTTGGLAASYYKDGYAYDYGPHEFCTDNTELITILKEVLADDLIVSHKNAAQFFNNQFIDYPAPLSKMLSVIKKRFLIKIFFEVIWQRLKVMFYGTSDYSFKSWVESRFGTTLYKIYFGPYTEKVWGIDPDSLDSRTASSRIAFNSIFDLVIKTVQHFLLGKNDYQNAHSPLKDSFYYSKGGIGTLVDKLAEKCRSLGVEFHLNHSLTEVVVQNSKVTNLKFTNGQETSDFDYCVSTIPLNYLLKAMKNTPHVELPLHFRAMVFVFLGVPKEKVCNHSWIYVPDKDICFQRITEFTRIDHTMAPQGHSSLCFEIACFKNDPIWNLSDDEVISRVRNDLKKLGLLDVEEKCNTVVVRTPYAYPIQFSGYLENVDQLLEAVRKVPNLVTTGRQGLYKYCNMNECMEMAIQVGKEIHTGATFTYPVKSKWLGAGIETERTLQSSSNEAVKA